MDSIVECAHWVGELMNPPEGVRACAITAGFGAGKTHGAVQNHFYWSTCVNTESPFSLWIEPDASLCKDMAIPIWEEVLQAAGLEEEEDYTILRSYPQRITLFETENHVRHHILFRSGEKPSKIVGFNASHATIDEPGIQEHEVFVRVGSRLRCKKAQRLMRFLPGTPEGDDNWFAKKFDIPERQVVDNHYRIRLHTRDNVFNPKIEEYIASLEQDWAHCLPKLRAYLSGVFTSFATNKVFSHYGAHLEDASIAPDPDKTIYLAFDFNAFPLAWSAAQINDGALEFLVASDAMARRNLADEVRHILRDVFPKQWYGNTTFAIYGDRSGHAGSHKTDFSDYQTIERVFFEEGRQCINYTPVTVVPIAGSVDVTERYLARGLIKVHPDRCRKLIESLKKTKWKGNTRQIEKPASDDWTHWSDGVRYLVYWLDKNGDLSYRKRNLSIPYL